MYDFMDMALYHHKRSSYELMIHHFCVIIFQFRFFFTLSKCCLINRPKLFFIGDSLLWFG